MEKLYQTMEQSTAKIHWMKEALDEWTTAMARGDETNKLIEKYCKEDRKRAEVNLLSLSQGGRKFLLTILKVIE